MLGIPGSGFLESRLMGAGTLGAFEEVTGLLGLNSGNAPVLLSLGDVQFSLNTAALQQVNRDTEASWAEVPRIGQLNALQYTGPGTDIWRIPCVIYPDWKGSANVIEALRMMARSGEVYFMLGANGDVIGLFVVRSVSEEKGIYKSNGDTRRNAFTLTLQRYAETAAQKKEAKKTKSLLGGVGRFVNTLENDVAGVVGKVEGAVGGTIGSVVSPVEDAVGGAVDSATNAIGGGVSSVTDPISKELGL